MGHLLTLDFETYYDDEYSLRKMPTPNYILDPRFEMQICAVQIDEGPHGIIEGPDFPAWLAQFDPAVTSTVTFNSLFDNSILSYRYGWVPARMYDAMGIARATIGHKLARGASLSAVAKALELPVKLDALAKVKGMTLAQIKASPHLFGEFKTYAIRDNQLCRGIFDFLIPKLPASERRLLDMVLRCAVEPAFQLDVPLLKQHLIEVRKEKHELLGKAGTTVDDLMSTEKFKTALENLGVVIEYKTSKATGRQTPAFAKTDKFMEDLSEHDDPDVQALASARLGHKSTIEETRTEKLLSIAQLPWPSYLGGNNLIPVPLGYGKAHTHRLAGEWGMNMQNLPSSRSAKSKLRKALIAPPGYKVITCDLGQIEARLTAWFCGAWDLLKQFADDLDPYAIMGSVIFGYPVDRKVQKVEGFIGKTAILGLGYGCGAERFFDMVEKLARQLKFDLGDVWTPKLAQHSVDAYRRANRPIATMWRTLDTVIGTNWMGKNGPIRLGPVVIEYGTVIGPNELCLQYDNPRREEDEYLYDYGRFAHKIYGAKLLENIVQFLARIVVMHAALRIRGHAPKEKWSRFKLQAHDELVYIVPDAIVEDAKKIIHMEMTRNPSWALNVPLKADVGVGQSYGEAK